jgi:hypothetical protein
MHEHESPMANHARAQDRSYRPSPFGEELGGGAMCPTGPLGTLGSTLRTVTGPERAAHRSSSFRRRYAAAFTRLGERSMPTQTA